MTDTTQESFDEGELRSQLDDVAATLDVVGATQCIVAEGRVRLVSSTGIADVDRSLPATPDTMYAVGSLAKIYTAFLVCQLVEEGGLALDDRVVDHLPAFRTRAGVDDEMTIRSLLGHTSGLPDLFEPFPSTGALLEKIGALDLLAPPGRIFSYANTGYALLGLILEQRTGCSWDTLLAERLVRPAGCTATVAVPPDAAPAKCATDSAVDPTSGQAVPREMWPRVGAVMAAAGSTLYSSAPDTAKLMWTCLTGRSPDGTRLLGDRLVREMLEPHVALPGRPLRDTHWGLGWALRVDDDGSPRHAGHVGGTSAAVRVDLRSRRVFVVLANSPHGSELARRLATNALDEPEQQAITTPRTTAARDGYEGSYRSHLLDLTVRNDDGQLWMSNPLTGGDVLLAPQHPDSYIADLDAFRSEVTFIREQRDSAVSGVHVALRYLPKVRQVDPADLHGRATVADTHNDLLGAVVARPVDRWGSFFAERWLPQLRDGGVDLQVLPVFIDDAYRPEGALRATLRMVECAHRIAEANSDEVTVCRDGAEIDAALGAGRIALVLALESLPGVDDDIELLETLFRLGVRAASLTHFGRTPLADGSAEDAAGSRLTRAGTEAVTLMEQLGMMLDVSHLGAAGVGHVLELATRPLLASHSSARALRDHHRNLTDEHLNGVAGTGGVVCVNFFGPFLDEREHTVDRAVDHVEHIVEVAGIDHVGLGPDFIKEVFEDTTPPCCEDPNGVGALQYVPGLEGPRGLPLITEALLRRGWSENETRAVLGENVRTLFRNELGRRREEMASR